jgi:cephalosporin hydroxylase
MTQNIQKISRAWLDEATRCKYVGNFTWMGRPVIQIPQDLIALQEIIWRVKPRLIIETGIAHGGSLVFHASLLKLARKHGRVVGIDVDIRRHNRIEIEKHPMAKRITMIEGSSVAPDVIKKVRALAKKKNPVMVILDSNHSHEHVLEELKAYSPLVTKGSYLVVFDTAIEDTPDELWKNRPWGKGNNPKTAVAEFLRMNDRFEIDAEIENKLMITAAPSGYLKCARD